MKILTGTDLFCGAGNASAALLDASHRIRRRLVLTAINHWDVAIATHSANFPTDRHLCTGVDKVEPLELYKRGELDILIGGPECIEYSQAASKKPTGYQYRPTPWCMSKWADHLRPRMILIENVAEFRKKWPAYRSWLQSFRDMGYNVDDRVFCAADYGDPTTRARLFIQCQLAPRKVVWPDALHAESGEADLFGTTEPWCSAADHVIDWSIKGKWLDEMPGKKKYGGLPLSPKTLGRIFDGLEKGGLKPVIAEWDNKSKKSGGFRGADEPLSTITSKARHGLAIPSFIVPGYGERQGQRPRTHSVDKPAPTICGTSHHHLVEAVLIHTAHGKKRRARSVDEPMPTITGNRGDMALCEFLLPQGGGGVLRPVEQPAPTVATDGAIAFVESFLVKFYGTGKTQSLKYPLPTVTGKDRFALVCPEVIVNGELGRVRVRWRMLQPHELARAQGFLPTYVFYGSKKTRSGRTIELNANKGDIVKQIGNAWPRKLGRAILLSMLTQKRDIRGFLKDENGAVAA